MNIGSLERNPCQATRAPKSPLEAYREMSMAGRIAIQRAVATALRLADERRASKTDNAA